jgi:hypothetical protein
MKTSRKTTTKPAKPSTAQPQQRRTAIQITASSEAEMLAVVAQTLTRPEVGAAAAIEVWQKDTHDVNILAEELARQVQAVNGGDLRRAEAMLISQAHTLDEIFVNLVRRAANQQYLKQWEAYLRVGMKAQAQCRATLQALAELKNPRPIAFVKQANIANGPQQVNNGAANGVCDQYAPAQYAPARAEHSGSAPNKLLEAEDGERLDFGAQSAAGGANQDLAAVGACDGAEDEGR